MSNIPIAVQLYSIKDDCAKDFAGSLKKVAEMGYTGVEFAGYHGHSAEQVLAMLKENNLACVGAHTKLEMMLDDQFDQTVVFHKAIGCKNLVVPWLPEERRGTEAQCLETAKIFTAIAKKLAGHNMLTGYHTHGFDVKPVRGDDSAWDIIAQNTPSNFIMQYDTGNGVEGGADAVEPLRKYPGRAITLHLKEYNHDGGHGVDAVGDGDIPWADVFAAAQEVAGTKWYIVEQEGHKSLSPMDAIARCIENLNGMLQVNA